MSNPKFNLLKTIAIFLYFAGLIACHKTEPATVYGTWETVSATGFKWQYDIARDGQFCKRLPEYFPDTSFCFDYQVDETGTVTDVQTPNAENWKWEFIDDDVADVIIHFADSTAQRLILKRIE